MIGEHKMGVSLCSIFKAQQCYLCLGVKACQSPQILNGLSDLNTGPLFIPTAPGENMARSEQYQLLTCVD